ncbi:MAG: tyrosine-type recombinase/integrase [Lachnospiraceae bacterium]
MSTYRSGFSQEIERFIWYRKTSGSWNEYASGQNLMFFDHYCADNYGTSTNLTQEMVDEWCTQRDTETSTSCYTRTLIVREFIDYLRVRGMTEVITPNAPKQEKRKYIPHAFTAEELSRFFDECDSIIPYKGRRASVFRKYQCPVFFRLLYSSGIRTTEARYLKREDVDLVHGVLNIRKSKGYDQHYVALHETMTELLARYDTTIDKLQPDRIYFFESMKGDCYGRNWVNDNFKKLWKASNGSVKGIVPYDLRHHYAVENISSWEDDSFTFSEKLHYLSKSMGHRWIQSTLYYYSIVPRLADKIQAKTELGFNEIMPEVWDEED